MKVVVALCLLAAAAVQVYAMPYGAPAQACANITPGGPHLGNLTEMPPYVNNTANMSDNPFMLDLSQFQCPGNQAGFCYIPGIHYLIILSGMNNEEFRGLLVQGRLYADQMTPAGTFFDFTNNTRESNCTPAESAVTHSNPSVKTSVNLYWMSPPRGTGDIEFLWAVVVVLEQNVSNIWYAPIRTALIVETDGCLDLSIRNGSVSYDPTGTGNQHAHFIGATATYACNDGYVLVGNSTRTCEANGTWTGSAPECIRICEGYTVPMGTVTYTPPDPPFREGTIGMTTCNNGLTLCGNATRACRDDGMWTGFTMCGAPFTTAVSLWLLLTLLAATYLL